MIAFTFASDCKDSFSDSSALDFQSDSVQKNLEKTETQTQTQAENINTPSVHEITVEYIAQRKNEVREVLNSLEQMIAEADEKRIEDSLFAAKLQAKNPYTRHVEINRIFKQDELHIQHLLKTWDYIKEQLKQAEKQNPESTDLKIYTASRTEISQIINTLIFIENYILTKELTTKLMAQKGFYGYDIFKSKTNQSQIAQQIMSFLKKHTSSEIKQMNNKINTLREKFSNYVQELKEKNNENNK